MSDNRRIGGDLVTESLAALGADTVFGIPGQHALGIFDALSRSSLRYIGLRTELTAALAAVGYGQTTERVAPLIISTGPGALNTLAALVEAATASVPVVVISSQVPEIALGGRRQGYLHELRDQQASARDIVKSVEVVRHAGQIPGAIAAAWRAAASAPAGPTWVEIPVDVLLAPTVIPPVEDLTEARQPAAPRRELVAEAIRLLDGAEHPVILAGGGVARAHGEDALLALAESLRAPVVTTFGAKGSFPWEHPLSAQSWMEDWHTTQFLTDADVLLVVGSGLGELSSNYHTFRPAGRVIQIDADRGKLEANHRALAIDADADVTLRRLADGVRRRPADGRAEQAVGALLRRVADRLMTQGLDLEAGLIAAIRDAVPDAMPTFWDMTILGYWAWSAWPARAPRTMFSAQGSGGLGYGFPAALGAAAGTRRRVLAVAGDGGAMYGLSDLATARQENLPVTWLIVDDGGYGILREYMTDAFDKPYGTELARPDFAAAATAFGIPAITSTPDRLRDDLERSLQADGPNVVVLPAVPRMFAPTHLEHIHAE